MEYYIKQCNKQELGSIGDDGRPHRGRYLLTSKAPEVLKFFPPLSETQKNDFSPLPCIPLYLKDHKIIYCNFVFHNDKYHGSTAQHPRNEYRLYLNAELEGGSEYRFKEGDILIFRKKEPDYILSPLYIDHLPKATPNNLFNSLENEIRNSPINGNFAVHQGNIEEFEQKVITHSKPSTSVAIDEKLITSLSDTQSDSTKIESLFDRTSFRDFLLVGYDWKCAITRTSICYKDLINLEAAHIRPHAHEGSYMPNNGLMLTRDLHWAFDKGFFSISDDFTIIIHPKINSEYLNTFNGKSLYLPKIPFFRPSTDNIKWHRDHIYGLFLTQGGNSRGYE